MSIVLNSTTPTTLSREQYGSKPWQAKTHRTISIHGKVARINVHTSKDGTKVKTTASIAWYTKDGFGMVSRMGFGHDREFHMQVIPAFIGRCTEKTVAEHHAQAIAHFAMIEQKARDHYPTADKVMPDAMSI
jgi:hypothetical protein